MFRPISYLVSSPSVLCEIIEKDKYLKKQAIPEVRFQALPGGIRYRDTKLGDGLQVERGDIVRVQYTARLLGGREVDSTQNEPGSAIELKAGGDVPTKGVGEGVIGMKEYGSRELLVPPSMHYPDRYPKQIIVYDIMVRKIEKVHQDSPS
jgi:FKBP-type peptidyl-prolyl cis-trans isomerase